MHSTPYLILNLKLANEYEIKVRTVSFNLRVVTHILGDSCRNCTLFILILHPPILGIMSKARCLTQKSHVTDSVIFAVFFFGSAVTPAVVLSVRIISRIIFPFLLFLVLSMIFGQFWMITANLNVPYSVSCISALHFHNIAKFWEKQSVTMSTDSVTHWDQDTQPCQLFQSDA